jgi:EAL domain-containing protein (putative c-di-GMP-specific phosphodiesterase class I)
MNARLRERVELERALRRPIACKLGCEGGQGFYFSPPVSADLVRSMLWQLRGPRGAPPRLRLLNQAT